MIVRFNESDSYFNAKEIVTNIKEICKELTDEEIQFNIEPSTDIRIKMLGLYLHGSVEINTLFYVRVFTKQSISIFSTIQFDKTEIILNTLKHLENYIRTEGLKFEYELYFEKYPLPKWLSDNGSRFIKVDSIDERIFDKVNPALEVKIMFNK